MFERLELLIGDKLSVLENKTVLIIGIGGVGGYTLEAIVRSGIKNIIICDFDNIDITNLNRQIITTSKNIGLQKVIEAKKRMLSINPNLNIKTIDYKITPDNLIPLLENKIDYIIDACDDVKVKVSLIIEANKNNIPVISSMGMANRIEPEKIEITNIWKTSYDPLAKIIRRELKQNNFNKKVMVVSSKEKPLQKSKLGTISYLPAIAGLYLASYVLRELIKNDK